MKREVEYMIVEEELPTFNHKFQYESWNGNGMKLKVNMQISWGSRGKASVSARQSGRSQLSRLAWWQESLLCIIGQLGA